MAYTIERFPKKKKKSRKNKTLQSLSNELLKVRL